MPITNPSAISALPSAPSAFAPGTFDVLADIFLSALPTFASQCNAAATALYDNAVDTINTKMTWQGTWSSATTYYAYAVVAHSGATYMCLLTHTNQTPPNATYWVELVSAGPLFDPSLGPMTVGGRITVNGGIREKKVNVTASNIDTAAGAIFVKTIAANTTFTVSNVPATGTSTSFMLELTNAGAYTLTWWSGVKWVAGTAPSLTASGTDVLSFYTYDGGSTWRGTIVARDIR